MLHKNRLVGLDIFRGWAIILMIAFHFSYDLNYFHFIHINLHHDTFWVYARYLIVSMFLLSMGTSLALVHRPKIQWNKIYKRTLILGAASVLVTIATYIEFPHSWVYFGILHFILLASWVGLLFLGHPILSLLVSISIFIGYQLGFLHTHWLFMLLQSPLHLPPVYTQDLVIFFPWFSLVLLGIAFTDLNIIFSLFTIPFFSHQNKFNTFLSFLGKHALLIYLLHLPILFGIVALFSKLIHVSYT